MKTSRNEFAERIKSLRKSYGLTQQQLADIIGVRKTTICNYESGYARPTLKTLGLITKFFNVPSSFLLDDDIASRKLSQILPGTIIPYYEPNNIEGLITKEISNMDNHVILPLKIRDGEKNLMATSAPDNALNKLNIKKDSLIIIQRTTDIKDGDVIAAIKGGKLIIRKYSNSLGKPCLTMESTKTPKAFSTEEIPDEGFFVLGIITKTLMDI